MSAIANLSSAAAALPALNLHPHSHKKASLVESADGSAGDTAGQVAAGTAQNLFSRLLRSLEQVIGVQLTAATPAATATPDATAANGAAGAATSTAGAATLSPQFASNLLQNYVNNSSRNMPVNGAPTPNVNLNA